MRLPTLICSTLAVTSNSHLLTTVLSLTREQCSLTKFEVSKGLVPRLRAATPTLVQARNA